MTQATWGHIARLNQEIQDLGEARAEDAGIITMLRRQRDEYQTKHDDLVIIRNAIQRDRDELLISMGKIRELLAVKRPEEPWIDAETDIQLECDHLGEMIAGIREIVGP